MYRQRIKLYARASHFPIESYGENHFSLTSEMIGQLRVKSYFDQWKLANEMGWYHLRLEDHSLFLFSDGIDKSSYSYLQCPLGVESFREYLRSKGLEFTAENRRANAEEYELVVNTSSLRDQVVPIRYDYDKNGYLRGSHPLAHLHIGLENDIRISVNRKMSCISFFVFVMRQIYPHCWRRLVSRPEAQNLSAVIRPSGTMHSEEFWSELDRLELFLG